MSEPSHDIDLALEALVGTHVQTRAWRTTKRGVRVLKTRDGQGGFRGTIEALKWCRYGHVFQIRDDRTQGTHFVPALAVPVAAKIIKGGATCT